MQKEVEIFLPLVLIAACGVILFTLAQPVLFLACALGLSAVVATILFPDKLTYVFVFALALMPRFVGIKMPGGLPDITCTRMLILYYFAFSLLLNRKTILSNLKRMRPDAVNIAMFVFVATNLMVFIAHINGTSANAFLVLMFENVFVFYFILLNIRDNKEVKGCFTALLLSACVLCLFAILEFATGMNVFSYFGDLGNFSKMNPGGNLKRLGFTRVYASFAHPIALGGYALLMFPIAFNLFLNEEKGPRKLFLLAVSGLLPLIMLLTLSRMPILCFMLGLGLLFAVITGKQRAAFLKIFLAVIAAGVVCFAIGIFPNFVVGIISSFFVTLTGGYAENFGGNATEFEDRWNLFQITKEVLNNNMLLGGGLSYTENHPIYFFDYRRNPYMKYVVDSFDNDHLKNLVNGGIIGFGGYLALYGTLLLKAFATMKAKIEENLSIISQSVFVAMLTYLMSLISVANLGTFKIFLTVAVLFVAMERENSVKPKITAAESVALPQEIPT